MIRKGTKKWKISAVVGWLLALACTVVTVLYIRRVSDSDMSVMLYINDEAICCVEDRKVVDEALLLLNNKLEAYNKDVFHSVTEDETKVYAKLVNAENFDKKVLIKFNELDVAAKAEVITLTGEAELVHKPNVNTKEKEWVVPVSKKATVKKSVLEVMLPANSVNVVVFDRV